MLFTDLLLGTRLVVIVNPPNVNFSNILPGIAVAFQLH